MTRDGGAFALGDVEDAVVFEVAECGGEATALVEGVFVDAEDFRALAGDAFASLALGELVVDALDGGSAQAGGMGHAFATNTVVVITVDPSSERFGGMPNREDSGQRLDEARGAFQTKEAPVKDPQGEEPPEGFEATNPPQQG